MCETCGRDCKLHTTAVPRSFVNFVQAHAKVSSSSSNSDGDSSRETCSTLVCEVTTRCFHLHRSTLWIYLSRLTRIYTTCRIPWPCWYKLWNSIFLLLTPFPFVGLVRFSSAFILRDADRETVGPPKSRKPASVRSTKDMFERLPRLRSESIYTAEYM